MDWIYPAPSSFELFKYTQICNHTWSATQGAINSVTNPEASMTIDFESASTLKHSKLKLRPLFLHPSLPLPLLPAPPLYPLIDPPQLHRKSWSQFLQPSPYPLNPLHLLPVRPNHALLGLPLVSENIPMPPQEDVISLIVQRNDLPAFEIRL